MSASKQPKALFFDVFGTVVDWRSTVTDDLVGRGSAKLDAPESRLPPHTRAAAATILWAEFAQAWRDSYMAFCSTYEPGATFTTVDQHFHDSLKQLLRKNDLEALWNDDEVLQISRVWHALEPWPDSSHGLDELNRMGLQTCTLSNGNIQLLEDLTTYGRLPFAHILSAEHFGAYKPSPNTYLGAAEKLGLKPEECAMVAAHLSDLDAARQCGLQTIYIERKGEEAWPPERIEKARSDGWVDMWIDLEHQSVGGGILEISRQFGE